MRLNRVQHRVTLPGLTQNRGMTMLKVLRGPTNRPAAPRNGTLLTRREGSNRTFEVLKGSVSDRVLLPNTCSNRTFEVLKEVQQKISWH